MFIVLLCLLSLTGHGQTATNPAAPTGSATQSFCGLTTVASLSATGTAIKWYNAATGGVVLSSSTYLTNGTIYYASQTVNGYESTTRLAVIAGITYASKPLANLVQIVCQASSNDKPTLASFSVTGTDLKWYDSETGGSVITSTTAIIESKHYYVSQTINGCESLRQQVGAIIVDNSAPTGNASQSFCAASNPTLANLTVTITGWGTVRWYDVTTGGSILASDTPLMNGTTYYASNAGGGSCESTRFGVTVTINNNPPQAPTGITSQTFCTSTNATVSNLSATGTAIKWYDAAIGGNVVTSSTALTNGTIYYASQTVNGCESTTRLAVTATINNPAAPTGTASQEFCKSTNSTVASLQTNESGVTWYDAAIGGNVVSSTTVLTSGTVYYGSLKTGTCESPTRLAVTVTISDPKTPTGTASQEFYKSSNATVASLVTNEIDVTWFDAATAGNVVPSTTILTDGTTYYGSLKTGTCESPTRLAVTVKLKEDPKTPTTDNTMQDFLKTKNPTVADLKVNESNVVWYDAPTGGNVVDPKTALVDGKTYYGATKDGDVESLTRVAVTVDLKEDPKAPTTTHPTQEFLNSKNPTVADLKVNESNVVWYDAPTGGNVVDPKTALVDGKTYYGATKDGDVESPTRVAVTVDLKEDPKAPTTTHPTQEFLNSKNPTVADLKVNESNVVWYDAPTGGNVVDPKTALVDGKTYYGATKDGDVESSTRLAVTVSIKTLGVKDFEFSNYFVLYPNPVSDVLTIKTKQDAEIQSLEVYDIFGQLVVSVPNAKSVSTVDVSNLSTGNYFIKVKSDKGSFKVKFVKK
ncbi:hypothetical protein B0A71_08210 [Flavobacterium tructae]|uniref:Por secretion system C-terminal sorting domain-containing protein n=2 Tax=Flavobacterium tructae TaxID=1114873 RepID=A0A1S1J390_9FLAO|nr:hypothetical protein BHE19_13785 [Flavobacterium tructae]OXB20358.1 hypothetical protein B0A71_08210 [Flavobacterium tructae]